MGLKINNKGTLRGEFGAESVKGKSLKNNMVNKEKQTKYVEFKCENKCSF